MTILVPVTPHARVRAWPDRPGKPQGARAQYMPLADALTKEFRTDAHTAAYSVPHIERRLRDDALAQLPDGVPMRLVLIDVDCPESHRSAGGEAGVVAGDAWWLAELAKVDELAKSHPDPYVFRTRGGYRILYTLDAPFVIRTDADGDVWTRTYLQWVAYLRRRFGIGADPGCKDWQRLYRLPHATRTEGGSPERRETAGNPEHVGTWSCEPSAEDVANADAMGKRKREPRIAPSNYTSTYSGDGVLFYVLRARGDIGDEIEPGKWAIRCPRENDHSKGQTFDSSTVLYAPDLGHELGWIDCKHSNCGHDRLTTRDWLTAFTPGELESARRMAGIERSAPQQAQPDTYIDEERAAIVEEDQSEDDDVPYVEPAASRPSKYDPERIVLASVLAKPTLFDLVRARLMFDDLTDVASQAIWQGMCDLVDRGTGLTIATLVGWLVDSKRVGDVGPTREAAAAYLEALAADAPSDDTRIDSFVSSLVDRSRLRKAGAAASKIASSACSYTGDVQAFVDRAMQVFRDLADRRDMQSIVHVNDALKDKFRMWTLAKEGRTAHGLATGIAELDAVIGGWKASKVYVLAARPGGGKSALALNTATTVARSGGGVAFFSMEMDREELTDRQLSSVSGVPADVIANPDQLSAEQHGRVTKAAIAIGACPLWIDDTANMSLSDIRAKVKRVDTEIKRGGGEGISLVVIDYLGLMQEIEKQGRSREQAVAANSRGLKVLAKEMKVPVLVLSQMNRGIEQREGRPRLSDLRESGSVEQDADCVMFLYKEQKAGDEKADGLTELIVAKNRGGRSNVTIKLCFKPWLTRFDSYEQTPERYSSNRYGE